MLDSIQSAAPRQSFGALCTSPTLSLCAEAGAPPLQFRFLSLTTNFLASTARIPQSPIFLPFLCTHNSLRIPARQTSQRSIKTPPPWTLTLPVIRLDLAALPRSQLNLPEAHQSYVSSPMNYPLRPSAVQMD